MKPQIIQRRRAAPVVGKRVMSARRIPDRFLVALALPVYQIWHIAKYADTREGLAEDLFGP